MNSYIQLVDVHGSDVHADMGIAGEVAKMLYPDRRVLDVYDAHQTCRHGYPVWAVEVEGPDPRIAYVPTLSGPPIRHLQEVNGAGVR